MQQLTDDSPFPFGRHKDKPMRDVPASYLDWLRGQSWLQQWPDVAEYIDRNEKVIDWELDREEQEQKELF